MEMDIEMDTQNTFQVDVGNLLAFNPFRNFPSLSTFKEKLVNECLQECIKLV